MQKLSQSCSCIECGRICTASSLAAHFRTHLKIKTIQNCVECGAQTFNNKFCSLSCNAIHNNKIRIRRQETNDKISATLLTNQHTYKRVKCEPVNKFIHGPVTRIWFKVCSDCNAQFIAKTHTRKYCSSCGNSHRIKNGIRTNRVKYHKIWLDSSWELIVAEKLDELRIKWHRPLPLVWFDSTGKSRKYYSDFYLDEYKIYIDPKNPYRIKCDEEKLNYFNGKIQLIYGDVDTILTYLASLPGIEPGTTRS